MFVQVSLLPSLGMQSSTDPTFGLTEAQEILRSVGCGLERGNLSYTCDVAWQVLWQGHHNRPLLLCFIILFFFLHTELAQ